MASSPAYPPQSRRLSVSHFFRPSVRLKSALYSLTIFIVVLVVLALNAASLASKTSTMTPTTTLNTQPTQDTLADSGEGKSAAEGKDAHLVDGGIQRSFEEPDYDLLSGLQPSEIGCDIPLKGEGPEGDEGVLIFLGIFSVADKKDRRDLYREIILPDYPKHLVTIKFILGTPPLPAKPLSSEGVERSKLMGKVNQEMAEHGDMVMLPMFDNIDLGKTHEYFKWVAKHYAGQGRLKGRPRFVVKADDDTILVMPNLISAFKDLDCRTNVYWGTSAGRSHYFGDYFRGLAYAMSWPLVSWIGNAPMPHAHITKIEDARTGQWLRHLDPITDPIKRIDMGWTMGDWNQLDVTTETVGLHWLKWDSWVREQRNRLLSIWENSTQEWAYDQGISPRLSIAKGKIVPKGAKEEHQRQKALGWDVSGNLGTGTEKEM